MNSKINLSIGPFNNKSSYRADISDTSSQYILFHKNQFEDTELPLESQLNHDFSIQKTPTDRCHF